MSAAGDRLQDTVHRTALALPDVSRGHPFTPGLLTERLVTDAVQDSYDLVAERLPRRDRPGAR
ncbi:hypothetical protein [Streptomyces soliscabiei]|uniref:hypothetical protein n=1 Tax=Streptomyces soliscabiei TaxID=588897 RepID=UPI0029B12A68|nr:hypothetical protein [Streptomyces sp. NY05-11A]MDX2678144.1 hypothetical protein [Streptomyces sp. NY05-11A]